MTRLSLFAATLALASLLTPACRAADGGGASISVSELARRLDDGSGPFVLDVRSPEEFAAGHVPGAVNIPHDELAVRIGELPVRPTDEVVVHCQRGGRARKAEAVLEGAGYEDVRDLEGHWEAWQAAGLHTETGAPSRP